jgi:NADH-quinone oxidoreductase subunit M
MSSVSPLLFLILVPILSAVLVMAGANPRFTSILGAALNVLFFLAVAVFFNPAQSGFQFVSSFPVVPQLGISFTLGADGLSLIMLFLSVIVTLAAVCVARAPLENARWFYASILLISAGVVGAFASVDVFFFYMFHELALIPTFLLIGIWGSGDRQAAAWKATVYLATGSFILLLGIIGLYLIQPEGARSFDLRQILANAQAGQIPDSPVVYLLLLVGFGILVSLFPFHTWAPQAYASAPAPASMLHAGVLKKFGLYGLIRLAVPILPESVQAFAPILLTLLACNILYVGYCTIAQRKLDLMLGYSSVMHMGYIFLGFVALNQVSLTGASLMLLSHGLTIAVLFALCGEIRERTGTLDFSELGGIARATPKLGLAFGFAAMASVGLPGFVGFAGELLVFFGAFATGEPQMGFLDGKEVFGFNGYQIATICAVWGIVISAIYMLRAYRRVFMGPLSDRWSRLTDLSGFPHAAIVILLAIMLFFGFFPQILVNLVTPALLLP